MMKGKVSGSPLTGRSARRPSTPRLSDVLALHDKYASRHAVKRVLGDAFLYRRNPVFRNVRDATLRAGFTYAAAGADRYYGWPLMALDLTLQRRVVPFVDNVSQLRELERRRPAHFLLSDLTAYGPALNPLLHESSHCLAFDQLDYQITAKRPTSRAKLLKIQLAEAFALSVERASGIFVREEPVDLYLHGVNTHVSHVSRARDPMRELHELHGLEGAFRIALASYLYTSFLYAELRDVEIDRIRAFAKVSTVAHRRTQNAIERLFQTTLEVGSAFRGRITSMYLRSHGFGRDLLALVDFDPLDYVADHAALGNALDTLAHIVATPSADGQPKPRLQ